MISWVRFAKRAPRFAIADLSVRLLDRQCWSDLVTWALRYDEPREYPLREALPYRPVTRYCHQDAERGGSCFCGRIIRGGVMR